MFLIVSSALNLTTRYGAEGAARLRDRMERLPQELTTAVSEVTVLFPDDPNSASRYGMVPLNMTTPPLVAQTLWALYQVLGLSLNDAVLLLGGDSVVPFAVLPNPAAGGTDTDRLVQSDSPYAFAPSHAAEAFQIGAVPDFALVRLPDFDPPDLEGFLALLDHLAAPPPAHRNSTFAVVNQAWFGATQKVFAGPATIRTTPPWSSADAEWRTQDARLLYFNLHGFSDRAEWRGFDVWSGNWCDAVRPADVVREAVEGAIVFAENCYGALVSGRAPRNSIALSMLAAGARAFVGSTGIAYGSFSQQPEIPIEADVLGADFVQELLRGEPAGHALARARANFLAAGSPPGWGADQQKTALEFVLYGNPLATF
jgi:hypothetical protein